jgi:hypothetical protein
MYIKNMSWEARKGNFKKAANQHSLIEVGPNKCKMHVLEIQGLDKLHADVIDDSEGGESHVCQRSQIQT